MARLSSLLGKILKMSHFQEGNMRVVTRNHQKGCSMTIFDTSIIPYKVVSHKEHLNDVL